MKKAVTLVLTLALCLTVLVGCGGKDNGIIGTWVATTGDFLAMSDEFAEYKDLLGDDFKLEMSWTFTEKEVTVKMNMLGEEQESTAEYTYADNKLTVDGNSVECTIKDNTMTMDLSEVAGMDIKMTFKKK